MSERRDLAAQRYETCFHEASHAVAAYLLGERIREIRIVVGEVSVGDVHELGGYVHLEPHPPEGIHRLEDAIVIYLAGEAGVRYAWATGAVPDERLGRTEAPPELTVEDVVARAPVGSSPEVTAVYDGYQSAAARLDEEHAWERATEWPSSSEQAPALMAWSRARTAAFVAEDRFQSLLGRLAGHLVEHGTMDGALVHSLLERWNETYTEPTQEAHDVATQ